MNDLDFLTYSQIAGENKLKLFNRNYLIDAKSTDFAKNLIGELNDSEIGYWTKTPASRNKVSSYFDQGRRVLFITADNEILDGNISFSSIGVRPVLNFSSLYSIPTNGEKPKKTNGILEVEYGYYPQKEVRFGDLSKLNKNYEEGTLIKTGNSYTTNNIFESREDAFSGREFSLTKHEEYEYDGKRYVRIEIKNKFDRIPTVKWFEVLPIKWLIDEESKTMITEKVIFSGIQFDYRGDYFDESDFVNTDIKAFLDQYLSKELFQNRSIDSKDKETLEEKDGTKGIKKSRLERNNPDKTLPEERIKLTNAEMLHNWIESGESVLIVGPSGIGKTEIIKNLYPDLIYLKLTNNMFPEKVVGSVNLQTGQNIPPDYAKTAILAEATDEEKKLIEENIQNIYKLADTIHERSKTSDKKVVILLDELLNVKPAVQSLVYTLLLNRIVEIGEGLKLPDNVVIVATGNPKKYSIVAQDLAEPLEKRFDHILNMEPRVGDWLREYAIPQKIHPTVIGYMLSKYIESEKSEKIEDMGYFYEEPEVGEINLDKYGCKGRTNDPRGWSSISKILYNFEENLREGEYIGKDIKDILLRSIGTKLREEWALEFCDYYDLLTLTPQEIIKGMDKGFEESDLPQDISQRFAYMTALLVADENEVEACRNFIREYCDPEYLSIYDTFWAGNDEKRIEKISELQSSSMFLHEAKEVEGLVNFGLKAYSNIGGKYEEYKASLIKEEEKEGIKREENERS